MSSNAEKVPDDQNDDKKSDDNKKKGPLSEEEKARYTELKAQELEEKNKLLDSHSKSMELQRQKKAALEAQLAALKKQLDDRYAAMMENQAVIDERNEKIDSELKENEEDEDSNLHFCRTVTVKAPMNIALVKYWGKRDVNLNLPLNSSLSATLDVNVMNSETTIETSKYLRRDEISLNGEEYKAIPKNSRLATVIRELRFMARREHGRVKWSKNPEDGGKDKFENNENHLPPSFFSQKIRIKSQNNFPTAAGLASSASGFAALTFGVAHLYNLGTNVGLYKKYVGRLSAIARQGSGSAARSMLGGFVVWNKGESPEGEDSIAEEFECWNHWPNLRFVICVANEEKKSVASTAAMIRSQKTSTLLEHRVSKVADQILELTKRNIKTKNFAALSELIMRDSNQLHAICQDSFPPIEYLNETSRKIIDMVHRYNGQTGKKCLAYTFDAGPNAVLITTDDHLDDVCTLVKRHFAEEDADDDDFFMEGSLERFSGAPIELENFEGKQGGVKFAIVTQIGPGPKVINDAFEVFDDRDNQ